MIKPAMLFIATALLAGCHAKGHSYLLQRSEPRRFASMDACVVEAKAKHQDGSQKYAGYVCVHKLLFVELSRQDFYDGRARPGPTNDRGN